MILPALVLLTLAAAAPVKPGVATEPAPTLCDTPAGRELGALLAVIDRGEPAAMRQHLATHFSPETVATRGASEWTQLLSNLHRRAPDGLVVEAAGEGQPLTCSARVHGADPARTATVILSVSPSGDRVVNIRIQRPPDAPDDTLFEQRKPGMTEAARVKWLEALFAREAKADRFSGAVLIARGEKVLLRRAYGMADQNAGVPNRPETLFQLGSMNKMFTSVAVAELVEAGKLSYDAPLSTYLPDYPNRAFAEKATLHQLLTHTSGLGDFFGPEFEAKKASIRALEDYLPLFANKPPLFEPGKGWSYSNAGMLLAGLVVERVSGQDYFAFVREHVYRPAGMKRSDSYAVDEIVPGLATGYTRRGGVDPLAASEPRRSNVLSMPPRGSPAGGGFSNVDELLRFSRALQTNALVSAATFERITTGKVDNAMIPDTREGYGFEDQRREGERVIGHGGMFLGANTDFRYVPARGYTVIVLSNYDPMEATILSDRALTVLLGK